MNYEDYEMFTWQKVRCLVFRPAMARFVPGTCAIVAGSTADGVPVTVGVCQRVSSKICLLFFIQIPLKIPFPYLAQSRGRTVIGGCQKYFCFFSGVTSESQYT